MNNLNISFYLIIKYNYLIAYIYGKNGKWYKRKKNKLLKIIQNGKKW